MTKAELQKTVEQLRSLKALLTETNEEIKALENDIVSHMKENSLTETFTNDSKITYLPQSRVTLDKNKLTEIFGDDLKPFEKTTTYSVLRIK